jgi:ABC-type long-subunit fatty acid transport system fused permease/ATPase subunit
MGGTAAPPRSKIIHWKIIIRLISIYKRLNQFVPMIIGIDNLMI